MSGAAPRWPASVTAAGVTGVTACCDWPQVVNSWYAALPAAGSIGAVSVNVVPPGAGGSMSTGEHVAELRAGERDQPGDLTGQAGRDDGDPNGAPVVQHVGGA